MPRQMMDTIFRRPHFPPFGIVRYEVLVKWRGNASRQVGAPAVKTFLSASELLVVVIGDRGQSLGLFCICTEINTSRPQKTEEEEGVRELLQPRMEITTRREMAADRRYIH